jgi:DNA-3-methyladenine glycosylase I
MAKALKRCDWTSLVKGYPGYVDYHDKEWGRPLRDDRKLFELLVLEGAQAGLSWATVLKKRDNYRKAYEGFDYAKVARYGEKDIRRLLSDPGLIRNRLKIKSSINNAQIFLEIRKEFGSFSKYIWSFVGNRPIVNGFKTIRQVPARTDMSDAIAKDLKKRGMSFVGSTIMYAYMQSAGLVNDHTVDCFCHKRAQKCP